MSKPSDICIVLCAFPGARSGEGWLSADEIRHRLERLGFMGHRTQDVAAWLKRVSKLDAPPIELRDAGWAWEYRATPFGETWVHNNLDDIWWAQQRTRDRLIRETNKAFA